MNKNLVAFLLSLWQGLLAEEYSIERRMTKSWNVLPDLFVLPPSTCSADNATVQCTTMGGKLVGSNNGCTCECNKEKSSFAFYNSWKCIDNTEFHDLSGCSLILNNRNARSPIITITRKEYTNSYLLPTLKSSSNCGVTNKGSNLTCSGTWRQLSSGLAMETFDTYVPQGYNNWYLYTKRSLDDMEGQVIRLNIDCQSHGQYCVILKINGTLRYGSHEMCTYENAIPIGSTKDRLQSSLDPIPAADYVNHRNPGFDVSDVLVYENSKAIKQKEGMTETLDSPMYSSLVGNIPHVYGSLKGLHKTHEDKADTEVTCTSQNKENSLYQSLNTFGQQSHGECQAPKYKKQKPDNKN